jgi:hypothetical protein
LKFTQYARPEVSTLKKGVQRAAGGTAVECYAVSAIQRKDWGPHDSACASEPARRVAGNGVALHAGFADIDALIDLPGIKIAVSLGDAGALLIGVDDLLRTGRKADSRCRQKNEASQPHGMISG